MSTMQDGLFDLPPNATNVPPPRKPKADNRASYTRHRHPAGAKRRLCDDCVTHIHEVGWLNAPLAQPIRWRRKGPDGAVTMLCERHKNERKAAE